MEPDGAESPDGGGGMVVVVVLEVASPFHQVGVTVGACWLDSFVLLLLLLSRNGGVRELASGTTSGGDVGVSDAIKLSLDSRQPQWWVSVDNATMGVAICICSAA